MDMTVYLTANSDKAREYFISKNYLVIIKLECGMNFDDVISEVEYQFDIRLDYMIDFEIENQEDIHDELWHLNKPVSTEYEPDLN